MDRMSAGFVCVWKTGRCSHTDTCACWILKACVWVMKPLSATTKRSRSVAGSASQIIWPSYTSDAGIWVFLLSLRCTFRLTWLKLSKVFRPVLTRRSFLSDARVWECLEQWEGLFFLSMKFLFFMVKSETLVHLFPKGNQDVESVMLKPAKVPCKNS